MFYFDDYKRNFVRWKSKYVERHLEDPSYAGFHVKFQFNETYENNFDDVIPGSLLYIDNIYSADDWMSPDHVLLDTALRSTSKYSALTYLKHLEDSAVFTENSRVWLLQGLIKELMYIQNKTPWYFQSLTGLDTAYKINHQGYRVGDTGKIEINTLESIDRRVAYIVDAYRTLAWDMKTMSWVLPENLRKFGMEIAVTEFQPIHTKDQMYKFSTETYSQIARFLDTQFPGVYNIVKKFQSRFAQLQAIFLGLQTGTLDVVDFIASLFILDFFTDTTIQVFQLHGCEFDVLGEHSLPHLSELSMTSPEALTNVLPIKFNRSNVQTRYSLLQYLISDDLGLAEIGDTVNEHTISALYESLYYRDRTKLTLEYLIKKAKEIAIAIIGGHMDPKAKIKNLITGKIDNAKNVLKDVL